MASPTSGLRMQLPSPSASLPLFSRSLSSGSDVTLFGSPRNAAPASAPSSPFFAGVSQFFSSAAESAAHVNAGSVEVPNGLRHQANSRESRQLSIVSAISAGSGEESNGEQLQPSPLSSGSRPSTISSPSARAPTTIGCFFALYNTTTQCQDTKDITDADAFAEHFMINLCKLNYAIVSSVEVEKAKNNFIVFLRNNNSGKFKAWINLLISFLEEDIAKDNFEKWLFPFFAGKLPKLLEAVDIKNPKTTEPNLTSSASGSATPSIVPALSLAVSPASRSGRAVDGAENKKDEEEKPDDASKLEAFRKSFASLSKDLRVSLLDAIKTLVAIKKENDSAGKNIRYSTQLEIVKGIYASVNTKPGMNDIVPYINSLNENSELDVLIESLETLHKQARAMNIRAKSLKVAARASVSASGVNFYQYDQVAHILAHEAFEQFPVNTQAVVTLDRGIKIDGNLILVNVNPEKGKPKIRYCFVCSQIKLNEKHVELKITREAMHIKDLEDSFNYSLHMQKMVAFRAMSTAVPKKSGKGTVIYGEDIKIVSITQRGSPAKFLTGETTLLGQPKYVKPPLRVLWLQPIEQGASVEEERKGPTGGNERFSSALAAAQSSRGRLSLSLKGPADKSDRDDSV